MDSSAFLLELYGRIPPLAGRAIKDLDVTSLTRPPAPGANTIAWLVWHLTRVQDHHVAELLEADQLWVTGDWAGTFGLDPDPDNTGYGHTTDAVMAVQPSSPSALTDYLDAVQARTVAMLEGMTEGELDRIVDRRWDPPVTLGVRLVSIADDSLQHLGQAGYVRGLLGA